MHSINEMASGFLSLVGKERVGAHDLPNIAASWLAQPEVQALLQAAWSPSLQIYREVKPYDSVYEDPDTGEVTAVHANVIIVSTVVDTIEYTKAITFAPDREPNEGEILLAEVGLREVLVETAIRGPKDTL